MSTETYPLTITRPPATVSGYRVLAWAELRHLSGMYPGGIVLAVSDRDEFVTWTAYTKDGGETWHASSGFYTRDHDQAWASFTGRCYGLATMFWTGDTHHDQHHQAEAGHPVLHRDHRPGHRIVQQ